MHKKFKRTLAVILSLLIVMTMIPMAVMPVSASEYVGRHNIKVEVVDWVVYDSGQIIGEFNAVEHGDAFYYESLTEADDGTFTFSYTLALERDGDNTAWDESSISFRIDSCEEEFMQVFEKSFKSNYYIEYNIKVSRRAGHSFSDWTDVGDGTHTRICSFCGTVETKAHSFSGANCITKGKCACGLESTKDSNTHTKPVKYVVNSENEFKHDEVYECCGVVNSNLDHKYDYNGMCKECKYQCEHTAYTNGICDVCRYKCPHTAIVDGECTLCGKVGIPYINRYWDEETKSVVEATEIAPVETIEIDGSFSTLQNECWYVVRGNISRSSLTVSGTAHLILADGATLNISSGLRVNEGNTLYIYAQSSSDNCGKLVSVATDDNAGIGGSGYGTNCGTIVINGGNIQAQAKGRGTGIGGGCIANGGNITINGGIVTATPSAYAAAIGGSNSGSGGNITINGGTVIANGRIGSCSGNSGNITINGGNVTSSGSIGGKKVNSIVINGGVISVISTSKDNAAIGGGEQGKGGSININGGVITATGGEFSSAIGGGYSGYVDSITITGGTVIATGSNQNEASVGSSNDSKNCAVVLSGGNIKASQVRGVSVTDGNGNDVVLNTITLSGASADTAVTKVEGITYGLNDVKTIDTDKLYFYLPADSALSAITAGGNEYICNRNLTYHTSHDWSDANGICTGCGDKCPHEGQTGDICEICGGLTHIHSFTYTANGNVITATCSNADGNCTNTNGGTLTISAPAELYTDGTISREAVIDDQLVESADYTVTYSTADGTAPKTAGTYTASVTIGGAIATVEFTLSNYAAKVTDEDGNLISNYKTLADAVTAAQENEDSTLTLLDDITVTTFQIINSGNFTIDLNGKTLLSESSFALRIQSGAHVTIKDSGEGGTVESKTTGASAVINYGGLTVESGTMKGDGGIDNRGFLNFIGGTAEGVTYSAINNCGSASVYGGVMKSENGNGITNDSGGMLNVYGGEISGCSGIANYDTAFLSGGEFKGNSYAAINLISGTVEITGGSFTGTDDEYGSSSGTPYGELTVDYTEGANLTLKGGEFPNGFTVHNTTSNALLAEGYAFYDANGNRITVAADATKIDGYVQVKDHYVARVTDKDGNEIEGSPYKTFAEAVTAASASEGSTLTLLDDITVDETVEITSGKFTLDVNGKTLLLNNSANIYVGVEGGDVDAANVTFTDTAGGGKITGFRLIYNYATAEITGNISLITDNYSVYNYGEMIISGNAYIYGRCAVNNENLLTVNGGTVESENEGIYNGKELIINNGNLNGSYGIWNVHSGTAEIYGGNIKGREFAVVCDGKTEIYGGTFVSEATETFVVNKQSYENSDLTVYGAEFPNGIYVIETTLNDLLADGYYFRDADGKIITVAENSTGIDGYVKVTKGADFSADAVVTVEDVVYNGTAQEPTVTVKVGSKTLIEGKDYTLVFENNVNAGTATVTVKAVGQAAGGIVGGGNSNAGNSVESVYTGEITKEFTILKADSSIDVYPEANKLTYNGEAQTLVVIGDSNDGSIVYSLDGEKYSPLAPTGTNAGEYTVYYKVIGDANHNDSEPETVTVTIVKKPVTVSATVPDRIYGDDYQVDTSKVVVTFDGVVDGDNVGYVVIDAYYHMHTVTDNAPVQVVYNVNGADAGNYQFPEYGDWMAPNYGVQATGKVLPRDIADAQIVLGDALIYNGTEQTQSIASVTIIGKDVTYTVSGNTATNVGVYELTITGNGNFTGTKTALFTITPKDISGGEVVLGDALKYIGYEQVMTVESVTVDGMDVTYTASGHIATNVGIYPLTVTGTGNFCGEITVLYEIEVNTSAIDGINTSNVKSTDIVAIEYFLYQLDDAVTDYADEDKLAEWDELRAYCNELLAKEKEITEEYKRIILAIRSYDESTVKSADKDALIQLNEDIYALALTDNLTEQKTEGLEEAHDKILVLLDKITVISDELKRIIEEVDKYVFESVKSTDKADIEQLIEDIAVLLATQNLTDEERALLENADETCDKLVAKIDETVAKINRIDEATNAYDESTVTSADKEAIEQLIADIKALTDGDNITESEREQLVADDETLDALLAKIESTVQRVIGNHVSGDILIFLPGEKIIKDCMQKLYKSSFARKIHIIPLYGRLAKEEQERVFDSAPLGKKKVIISTNIAETSVTIPGITVVIDSGLAKLNFYNP